MTTRRWLVTGINDTVKRRVNRSCHWLCRWVRSGLPGFLSRDGDEALLDDLFGNAKSE